MALSKLGDYNNLEDMFKAIDDDGNGFLDPKELQNAMSEASGEEQPIIEIKRMILAGKGNTSAESMDEAAINAFNEDDFNVPLETFQYIMQSLGVSFTQKDRSRRASKEAARRPRGQAAP